MIRLPGLLAAGMLLSVGTVSALALPALARQVDRPAAVDLIQYNDGGRCYNRCVSGRSFRRCATASDEGGRASCCSTACNRFQNLYGR
jgi:hypothetical protein